MGSTSLTGQLTVSTGHADSLRARLPDTGPDVSQRYKPRRSKSAARTVFSTTSCVVARSDISRSLHHSMSLAPQPPGAPTTAPDPPPLILPIVHHATMEQPLPTYISGSWIRYMKGPTSPPPDAEGTVAASHAVLGLSQSRENTNDKQTHHDTTKIHASPASHWRQASKVHRPSHYMHV